MRHFNQKGIKVNHTTEHPAKKPSTATGLFATLRGLHPAKGSGAFAGDRSPAFRAGPRLALLPAVFVLLLGVGVAPAVAAGEPPKLVAKETGCGVGNGVGVITRNSVSGPFHACFLAGGLETTLKLEWSAAEQGPWTPVPGGTKAYLPNERQDREEYPQYFEAGDELTGLTPETVYYLKLTATNSAGEASEIGHFETTPLRPQPDITGVRNTTATSAVVPGSVNARGFATDWRYELSTEPGNPASWAPVSGAAGTITRAEAEAYRKAEISPEGGPDPEIAAHLTLLNPATTYSIRVFAEDEPEPGVHRHETSSPRSFATDGPPATSTFLEHALDGETIRMFGSINPESTPTSAEQTITIEGAPTGGTFALTFNGQTTGASGSGDIAGGGATGSGDISGATGRGTTTEGSNTITDVATSAGAFAVGQLISESVSGVFPENTTITAVGAGTLTLSAAAARSTEGETFNGNSKTITDVNTSTGAFAVGQRIAGSGIAPNTAIAAVGPGTLTLSSFSEPASGTVALTATNDMVANVSDSSGVFVVGEAISGPGFAPGTTITAVESSALSLSADTTTAETGATFTTDLPYNAKAETVTSALQNLPGEPRAGAEGTPGGPYTIFFDQKDGEVAQPQIEGDPLGLRPVGTISIATVQQGGVTYDTHYHFQYVGQEEFAASGWTEAAETSPVSLSAGNSAQDVSQNVPGLKPGETYHFRLVATSTFPGSPVVTAEEQTLLAPAPAPVEETGVCPNAQFRTGSSENLPDCRAYEQVTPVDKEGATEVFKPELPVINGGTLYGEDGDHFMVEATSTKWGSTPRSGQGPYFFTRNPQTGWQMTAAASQPEAGVNHYEMNLVNPDLTAVGLTSSWTTGKTSANSATDSETVEYKAGPPGGPYTTISTPRKDEGAWVAASEDFSKLILSSEDRSLAAQTSTTRHGLDLYEVSGGEVRQLNVQTGGATIGTCGALMASGSKEGGDLEGHLSSRHAVSADGSRVLFEAVPGNDCEGETKSLYMRENGAETVDIGVYKFVAADAADAQLLLERGSGEFFLYETESGSAKLLATPAELAEVEERLGLKGRYSYFEATEFLGFHPGGTERPWVEYRSAGGREVVNPGGQYANQLWRYDHVEHLFECISCASPFNPEPRLSVGEGGANDAIEQTRDGTPSHAAFSQDGDYAFFDTPAALVPQDVNGEVHHEPTNGDDVPTACGGEKCLEPERPNATPSNDIYEWRKDGVQGCAHVQGCLSLITPGRDGFLVELIGTTPSGDDVFFYTNSQLVPRDNDTAGDIYDARIDGGFAEPTNPIECEGDSCSTPFAAPNDLTPSSATFHGAGDVSSGTPTEVKSKQKKKKKAAKKKVKKKAKRHGLRRGNKAAVHSNKSDHRRGR
jgi:hypothetical protein